MVCPKARRCRAYAVASTTARRIMPVAPIAVSQREVLSTTPAAVLNPSSIGPIG